MVHLSSIDWVQQVWNGAPRRHPLETYSQVRALEEKGGCFCGAAVVEVFYSSSVMKKKERMTESLNHPISLSHVEPSAKTSKHKPVLWFHTLSSCVFGIFHRLGLMSARISSLHSHAKLNIPALSVKKGMNILQRLASQIHLIQVFFTDHTYRSRELLPFHFKAPQSGIFFLQQSYLI